MRLLIVTRERDGERAYGLGRTVGAIARELEKMGHFILYFSAEGWGAHESKRIKQLKGFLSIVSSSPLLNGAWAERLLQGWRSGREAIEQNISHVWFQDPWLVAGFYLFMLRHGRVKIPQKWGVSEHGFGSFESAVGYDGLVISDDAVSWLKKYERMVLDHASWVWSPTHTAMKKLRADLGYVSLPAHWSAIGYGLPHVPMMSKKDGRKALEWEEETIYIISVGRITPAKGMDLVVKAYAYVRKHSQKKVKLIILGDGNRPWLQAIADAHEIEIEMGFVGDITPYLRSADIYVGGGCVESFGYANLEALAGSIASIVISGGANHEVVGGGAWIVDKLDEALLEMVENPECRKMWRERGDTYIQKYPRWEELGSVYEQSLVG